MDMRRVFVSYSRRNKNFAERLARDLSDAGLDVWIDFRQIHGGEVWREEIRRGLERSGILIACISPDAIRSEWVQFEINTSRELGKLVVPIMVTEALTELHEVPSLAWLQDVQFINFENRYEEAFPQLLTALPGTRPVSVFDDIDPNTIPNPFKGLEAFQQTDARFFFGREALVRKALSNIRDDVEVRFLAVVGASGSGKSSLVRAGMIPQIRSGSVIPGSEAWRVAILSPGSQPVTALATRLTPLIDSESNPEAVEAALRNSDRSLHDLSEQIMRDAPASARLLLLIDQFEEVFTRASDAERDPFIRLIRTAAVQPKGRTQVLITMRADFFDRIGSYPDLAELFEQENMLIVTEMTAANLLRSIEGPAQAVGLTYEDGLAQRILDDVRRQPGSLPLLQYALKALYEKRAGRRLTHAAYDAIGGMQRALAGHAETIYSRLPPDQQDLMRRLLLRLVEISERGEPTRRRVDREELNFAGVSPQNVQDVLDLLTAPESRLLIASREIRVSGDMSAAPTTWIEVSHEALIREWDRLRDWIDENIEGLRYGSELLKAAADWNNSDRDPAYLLTGTRLMHAEEWLPTADANALQREFVRASIEQRNRQMAEQREQAERELMYQRRAAARLRAFVGVLLMSLVVAIGLIVFALAERARAEENARLAEANAARAEANAAEAQANAAQASSFALAASADRALADNNGDLALGLAVEALRAFDPPPPQSRLTMADVAFAPGTRRVFTGHTGALNAVAYNPLGGFALSAGGDGRVRVWDVDTGATLATLADPQVRSVSALAIRADGQQALAGSDNGVITIWDLTTFTLAGRMAERHSAPVNALAYSPTTGDSSPQIALSVANDGTMILWDVDSGAVTRRLRGHTGPVTDAAFHPQDGRIIASVSRGDRRLIFWDASTGQSIQELTLVNPLQSLAFNPTGTLIAVGQSSGQIDLWNVQPPARMVQDRRAVAGDPRTYSGHSRESQNLVRGLTFSPSGTLLASGSTDGQIIVWEAATGRLLLTFNGHVEEVRSLSFSPDSLRLLSGARDRTLRLWDLRSAAIAHDYSGHERGAVIGAFAPDGWTLVSGASDGTVRLWDLASRRAYQELTGFTTRVLSVDMTADGRYVIASADSASPAPEAETDAGDTPGILPLNPSVIVWDAHTGQPVAALPQQPGAIHSLKILPGGAQVVTAGRDGAVVLWDLMTLTEVRRFAPAPGDTMAAQFAVNVSADGMRVAAGGTDQVVRLWDVASGALLGELRGHNFAIRALGFAPDGSQLVSGAIRGELIIWPLDNPDELRRFEGHTQTITSASFSPDGQTVLSGALDFSIRVWDAASGFVVRRYTLDAAALQNVQSVVFSADGELLLSGQSDGTLRLWRLYPTIASLLAWTVDNRYVPPLTCQQREQFRLQPLCDADGNLPELAALSVGRIDPLPETLMRLSVGDAAYINTTNGDRQRLRSRPGVLAQQDVLGLLDDHTRVTLLEGPVSAPFDATRQVPWWRVAVEDGREGWVAEFDPVAQVQSLVPAAVWE